MPFVICRAALIAGRVAGIGRQLSRGDDVVLRRRLAAQGGFGGRNAEVLDADGSQADAAIARCSLRRG